MVYQDDNEYPSKNTAIEPTSIHSDQLLTVLLPTDDVIMPTEKVGCILVTSHLQQFLEDYPPSSDKQAFLDVYHMLSLLDKYLDDNPKQHTHCMSSDNEYVTLLKYMSCHQDGGGSQGSTRHSMHLVRRWGGFNIDD